MITVCMYIRRLVPSTGKTRTLSADSCKHIQQALSLDCTTSPESGVYWVQNKQVINKAVAINNLLSLSDHRFIVT